MTHKAMNVRSGLTAIAAVLALSSTPLGAQDVTTPPDPVTETPAEPPPAADPLAPEPTATEPAAEEPAASEATPAETAAPATTRRTSARARTAATNRAPSEPVRSAAPAAQPQSSDAALEAAAVPPPPTAPVAEPVAPPAAEPVAAADPLADEAVPIAGAAGLGLLALAGIGLAVRSRRRRREEMVHHQAAQAYLDEHPPEPVASAPEPAFARATPVAAMAAPAAAAVRSDAPRTKLPNGFDLSRFGPHVRAAYLGPTPDNPSLSLKHRLHRAAAMDQQARKDTGTRQPDQRPAGEFAARKPAWTANRESFMLRRAGSEQPSRPAFQHKH